MKWISKLFWNLLCNTTYHTIHFVYLWTSSNSYIQTKKLIDCANLRQIFRTIQIIAWQSNHKFDVNDYLYAQRLKKYLQYIDTKANVRKYKNHAETKQLAQIRKITPKHMYA